MQGNTCSITQSRRLVRISCVAVAGFTTSMLWGFCLIESCVVKSFSASLWLVLLLWVTFSSASNSSGSSVTGEECPLFCRAGYWGLMKLPLVMLKALWLQEEVGLQLLTPHQWQWSESELEELISSSRQFRGCEWGGYTRGCLFMLAKRVAEAELSCGPVGQDGLPGCKSWKHPELNQPHKCFLPGVHLRGCHIVKSTSRATQGPVFSYTWM